MAKEMEFLSLEEVAEMLGVTYQLMYRLVRSGELPAIRLGKLYRVSRRDLDGYLARSKNVGGGTCSVCGTFYKSLKSLEQTCQVEGCEEPICFDCWNRSHVRLCPKHEQADGKNGKA